MASVFENPKFKKWMIVSPIAVVLLIFAGFMTKEYFFQSEQLEVIEARKKAALAYELKYREVMRRVYDNLKLQHYLAAYRNLEGLEAPSEKFKEFYTEYYEVLARIARGMYDNDFLDESEMIFTTLSKVPEYEEESRNSSSAIASKRRWTSARRILEQAQELLREKRFRDSLAEFNRAKLEYDSVLLYKIHKVDDDLLILAEGIRAASYEVLVESADVAMKEALAALNVRDFETVQAKMQHVAGNVGRAAYYGGITPRVQAIRQALFDLEAQLGLLVPNSRPIWNRFDPNMLDRYENYFILEDFVLQPEKNLIALDLAYQMQLGPAPYYVVRYKVHLKNGTWFFNGFFIEKTEQPERGQSRHFLIKQELPEEFLGMPIRKVEVGIYNYKNEIVSRISRAFKV